MTIADLVPEWLAPLKAKAEAEHTRKVAAERTARARERVTLRAQLEREVPDLVAQVDTAWLVVKARVAELREAELAHAAAIRAKARRVGELEHAIRAHEAFLFETASPVIAAAVTQLQVECEATARAGADNEWGETFEGRPVALKSTRASLTARVEALRAAAREHVPALALEPLTDAQLEQRLAAIRDALPIVRMEPV